MHYILRACLGKSKDVLKVCLFKEICTLAEKGAALVVIFSSLFSTETKSMALQFAAQLDQLFPLISACWEA